MVLLPVIIMHAKMQYHPSSDVQTLAADNHKIWQRKLLICVKYSRYVCVWYKCMCIHCSMCSVSMPSGLCMLQVKVCIDHCAGSESTSWSKSISLKAVPSHGSVAVKQFGGEYEVKVRIRMRMRRRRQRLSSTAVGLLVVSCCTSTFSSPFFQSLPTVGCPPCSCQDSADSRVDHRSLLHALQPDQGVW